MSKIVCIGCDRELKSLAYSFTDNLYVCAKCFTSTVKSYLDEGMDLSDIYVLKHYLHNGKVKSTEKDDAGRLYSILNKVYVPEGTPVDIFVKTVDMRKFNEDLQYQRSVNETIDMLSKGG